MQIVDVKPYDFQTFQATLFHSFTESVDFCFLFINQPRHGIFFKCCGRTHGVSNFPFAYDHVFQPEASQADIYQSVARPIVEGVINGGLASFLIG